MSTFVAIDFETATTRHDSACAVGLAAGCNGRVVLARTYLIRPPTAQFTFTDLHGLDWEDVHDAPTFAELWPTLRAWIDDAAFVAAHNAPFDQSVLHACCARYRLRLPRTPFTCTVQLARAQWGIRPTKLPDVCRRLRIPLRHHDAGADALACASIVLAAMADGWLPGKRRTHRTATRAMARVAPPVGRARSTDLLRWPAFGRGRLDAVIAGLLFIAGMRRSEVSALRWADCHRRGRRRSSSPSAAARRTRTREGEVMDVRFVEGAASPAPSGLYGPPTRGGSD